MVDNCTYGTIAFPCIKSSLAEAFKKICFLNPMFAGTKWLVREHKKCLSELEHLKGLLADLHRWIDVIHERGQALFKAFNELRNHLEDLQRQIKELHLQKHNNQVP